VKKVCSVMLAIGFGVGMSAEAMVPITEDSRDARMPCLAAHRSSAEICTNLAPLFKVGA